MRAPPESLMPITGQPILAARSMILHIFSAITSPSEPPNTVKSWEKTHTRRPSIVPWPVTTASPNGRFLSISKSVVRWRTYVSSSWNEPGSSSFSIRSRAVYLPFACCFSTAFSEAWWIIASRSSCSCARRSSFVSGLLCRMVRAMLAPRSDPLTLRMPRDVDGAQHERALLAESAAEGAAAERGGDPALARGVHGEHAVTAEPAAADVAAAGVRLEPVRECQLHALQRRTGAGRSHPQHELAPVHAQAGDRLAAAGD